MTTTRIPPGDHAEVLACTRCTASPSDMPTGSGNYFQTMAVATVYRYEDGTIHLALHTPDCTELARHLDEATQASNHPLRCGGSNTVQPVVPPDDWAEGTDISARHPCIVCGQRVKLRVRGMGLPRWARVLPHLTDGTPCR